MRKSNAASGARSDRAGLRRALAALDKGDVLMVTRLDRLALNTVEAITGRGAGFKSIADTWADSTTAHGRLMLAVLSGLAEFESSLIHARTGEGRERAKARGVKSTSLALTLFSFSLAMRPVARDCLSRE